MGKSQATLQATSQSTQQAITPAEPEFIGASEDQRLALELQASYGNQAVVDMLGVGGGGGGSGDGGADTSASTTSASTTSTTSTGTSTSTSTTSVGGGAGDSSPPPRIATGTGSSGVGVRASTNRYVVRKGDTLSGIAKSAGFADYSDLYNLNRDLIMDADLLQVGWDLVLPEGWVVPGMNTNPNLLTGDPLALTDTAHTSPTLDLGFQENFATGEEVPMTAREAGDVVQGARTVDLVTQKPVTMPGGTKPAEAQLFVDDPAGAAIERQAGTLDKPQTFRFPEDTSIFIAGQPWSVDLVQGGVGDCSFISALLGIVAQDPGQIAGMMSYAGGRATVTLHRQDASGAWIPASVEVTNDLLVDTNNNGDLNGLGLRVANAPLRSDWTASIYAKELSVTKAEYYEWALWAPLMEKAYARFAEQYGEDGEAASTTGSGYQKIDGEFHHEAMQVIYGGDATYDQFVKTAFDSTTGPLVGNEKMLEVLATFVAEKGDPGPGGGEQAFLSLYMDGREAVVRLGKLVDAAMDAHDPWFWEKDTLTPALTTLRATITTWEGARTEANRAAVVAEAAVLFTQGAHPELTDPKGDPIFRQLTEALAMMAGQSDPNGRMGVLDQHSYNVYDVTWASNDGQPLAVDASDVQAAIPRIDPVATQVVMENPHAGHEMDLDGDGPDSDEVDDGRFTLSLTQVLQSFSHADLSRVQQP